MGERISFINQSEQQSAGHIFRYIMAAGLSEGQTVLDAACGTGYPYQFFPKDCTYYGVDKSAKNLEHTFGDNGTFIEADLNTWQPDFNFDVFVSFETIEHIKNYKNLISAGKNASTWFICSVPVIPTKHMNPYHLHDFKPLEMQSIVQDEEWKLYDYVQQKTEFAEIYLFKRH